MKSQWKAKETGTNKEKYHHLREKDKENQHKYCIFAHKLRELKFRKLNLTGYKVLRLYGHEVCIVNKHSDLKT